MILGILGLLHVAWAFGGRPRSAAVIPTQANGTPVVALGRGITLLIALGLFLSAFLLLERGGVGPGLLPRPWPAIGTAGVAAVLLLRGIGDFWYVGLFKRERSTPFSRMDTRLYTPLVLALAAVAGFVALRGS
jgi:hypothetical protein